MLLAFAAASPSQDPTVDAYYTPSPITLVDLLDLLDHRAHHACSPRIPTVRAQTFEPHDAVSRVECRAASNPTFEGSRHCDETCSAQHAMRCRSQLYPSQANGLKEHMDRAENPSTVTRRGDTPFGAKVYAPEPAQ